jgi:Cys-tRNA(Pro)/Cys-tRNA(Cys) deacylase
MTPAVRFLESQSVPFDLLEYEIEQKNNVGIAAARAMKLPAAQVFKTLIAVVDKTQLVTAVIPVAEQLDLKALSRAAHAKGAQLAQPVAAEKVTGFVTGGISPFGQKKFLPTYLAAEALSFERIYVSGGRRGLEIAVATEDLVRCCRAHVCELGRAHEHPGRINS